MINDVDALGELLRGTVLAERPIQAFEIPDSHERVFGVEVERDELLPVWRVARSLLDRTERWPVAANSWPSARRENVRPPTRLAVPPDSGLHSERRLTSGREAISAIRSARATQWPLEPLRERLEYELNSTRHDYGEAPSEDDVLAALASDTSEEDLDRWLLDWEERQASQREPRAYWHLDWFFDEGSPLMFVPARSSAETLAYLEFYGEQAVPGASGERLATILDYWEERYGAELVAHWGTMLQFTVARPPPALDQAWELACEQSLIAGDTLSLAGVTIREHARALLDRPTWFLHSRP